MKITARKLISLTLALLLALSIIPAFSAFAVGIHLKSLSLDVVMPTVGKFPTFAKVDTELYESKNDDPKPTSQSNGVVWTNETSGVNLTISNVFKEGCTYTYSVSLYTKSNSDRFDSSISVNVSGNTASVNYVNEHHIIVSLTGLVPRPSDVVIKNVDLTVVNAYLNKYPTFAKVNTDQYESKNDSPAPTSQTNGVVWTNETSGINLNVSNVFRENCIYTYSVSLYAKDGYAFSSGTTATVNGQSATLTVNSAKNAKVTLTDIVPKYPNPFTDMPDGTWYTEAALYCNYHSYMNGTTDKTFSPMMSFSRAMFVTVLSKIDGADVSTYEGSSFSDVPTGKWYSKPIEWAYQKGYAAGTGGGKFGPDTPITRETLAQFFYTYSIKNLYAGPASVNLSKYTDVNKISPWAMTAVSWAVGAGLISGTSDTTISPQMTASRAQVAVIVKKFVENIITT